MNTRRAGFTLIETVFTTVIVSVLLVGALNTLGAAHRARIVQTRSAQGADLAHALLLEVFGATYVEPDDPPVFGREAGELSNVRSSWDDVDDYDGWWAGPPQNSDGSIVPNATGWQRSVTISYADPATLAATGIVTDTGLKLIVVAVTAPNGAVTIATGVRSAYGILEL